MEALDITLSRTSERKHVGEALQRTLAGTLASLENIVHVQTDKGTVKVWTGDGWTRTYTVRYGNDAANFGPVSRIKVSRV